MSTINTAMGLMILTSGMPAAFMASNSSLSPMFPKEMSEASNIARGSASETRVSPA